MNDEDRVNILLVDDTPANLVSLEAVLSDLGERLVKAHSGREALKQLLRDDFAVILMDVNMPVMDGFETASLIRQRARSEHTPIIFVTANSATETGRSKGYSLGAVDYIYAPVVPEILRAKVSSFVQLSKVRLLHQRAEERARQEAARAKTLAQIAAQLSARLDVEAVLATVCEATARAMEAPAALVALYDRGRRVFCPAADYGLPADYRPTHPVLPDTFLGDGPYRKGLYRVPAGATTEAGLRPWVTAYMGHDGEPMATLVLFGPVGDPEPSDSAVEFLQALADQASLAISNALLFDEVRQGRERLRKLGRQLVMVQEDERRHISRELHDEVGQIMAALRISLGLIRSDLPADAEPLQEAIFDTISLADRAIEDIRAMAHNLRPPVLDESRLNEALDSLCDDFSRYTRLQVHYSGMEVPPLPGAVPISFYRFLQEALTNAAKHAQASTIQVSLVQDASWIRLQVEDNGVGFDPTSTRKRPAGIGLLGLQERFEMLGGWLELYSEPGRGARLLACVPLEVLSQYDSSRAVNELAGD
jgi:signal transduction histidine kinase